MRVYECERCGLRLDRDVNAAINVLVRAFGDEARRGGATPIAGQHTPWGRGGLWPATCRSHSITWHRARCISPLYTLAV